MTHKQGRELKEFNRLYKEIDEVYHTISLKMGLSDSAFMILYTLAEYGDNCLQKDIAEYYCISKQTINSSIKKLEAQGYITLEKGKRRELYIHLTPAGKQLMEKAIFPVIQMENSIFESMGPKEGQELLRLMEKYVSLYREKTNHL